MNNREFLYETHLHTYPVSKCARVGVKEVVEFYKENGYFRLQPENDTMQPILVNDVTILGKVVGLFRRYN